MRTLVREANPTVDVHHHQCILCVSLRRLASILLLLAFLGIGTGAFEYWHNLDQQASSQSHDENNCPTHAILRSSTLASDAPLLLCRIDDQLDKVIVDTSSLISQHTPARIDCRGPPAC